MKRITYTWLAAVILAGVFATLAGAQSDSLGAYARSVRKDKKQTTTKQYDNDNLPKNDKLSVVGPAPAETADNSADKVNSEAEAEAKAAQAQADQSGTAVKPADSAPKTEDKTSSAVAEKQKLYDEWKGKISAQKNKIDLASRELDVLQREYRLRAAAFYADAGNRLRNSGTWDKEDATYKQQIDQKQKALADAKQQLDDMQEQARKSGVPSSMRE
jgi:hypothetical protein